MIINNLQSTSAPSSDTAPLPNKDLTDWLGQWGVDYIGNGDDAAGVNTLVGLCGILANVAGPDAVLADKTGDTLAVGMDWITVGQHSGDLLRAIGLNPLADYQTALLKNTDNLRKLDRRTEEIEEGKAPAHRELTRELGILDRKFNNPDSIHGMFSSVDKLLDHRQEPMEEVKERPLVFLDGSATTMFQDALSSCHRGYPYVCFSPSSPAHFAKVRPAHEAVTGGRQLESGIPVRGRTTILTNEETFAELASERHGFCDRLLVLADDSFPKPLPWTRAGESPRIEQRFNKALRQVLGARLASGSIDPEDMFTAEPVRHRPEMRFPWRTYLHALRIAIVKDPVLPDSSFAIASRVFASLAFGLRQLSDALDKRLSCSPRDVGALTIFVVRNSLQTIGRIRDEDEIARMKRVAASCLTRLAETPHTARELCRHHNRLRIDDCRRSLAHLMEADLVVADGPLESPGTRFSVAVENR